jgi:hypothetical protein
MSMQSTRQNNMSMKYDFFDTSGKRVDWIDKSKSGAEGVFLASFRRG